MMAGSSRKSIGHFLALTLLAWGFSPYSSANETPYRLTIPGYYGVTYADACAQFPLSSADPATFSHQGSGWTASSWTGSFSVSGGKYGCVANYTKDGYSPKTQTVVSGGVPVKAYKDSSDICVSGETATFSWPIGREKSSVGDSSFVSFGNSLPSKMCLDGCEAVGPFSANSDTYFGSPDSANPGYEIISANIDATLSGSACNSSDNVSPDIPDIPSDPGEGGGDSGCVGHACENPGDLPGGGDTGGGGDSGGGSGGGGNSGSPVTPPDPVDTSNPDSATGGDVATLGNRLVDATYAAANGIIGALNGLGNKVDGVAEKVDGLGDKLDGLNGDPYSEGAGENPGNGEGLGDEAGKSLAEQINEAVDAVVQEREDALDEDIAGLDSMVSGMLGESPDDIGGSILDGLFPSASGCSDFSVSWHSDYPPLILPVCELTRTKAILEWVFGILAAIYVWRTIMSTLNMSATNAVRNAK